MRKFGYSNAKNLKPEHLKLGWGDQVCAVIDELLNLELYRREFQFKEPKFPQDDEDFDEGDEINDGNGANSEQIFVINGGGGQIEIREGANLLMDGTFISKKNRMTNNVEETKMNFYDPNAYGARQA